MNTEKKPKNQENTPAPQRKKKPAGVVFLLVLLSILLVLTSLVAVFGYDIWRVIFNPTLVKQLLTDEILNSPLVARVLEDMSIRRAQERVESGEALSGVNEPDVELLLSYVGYEEWEQIKDLLITEEFVTHLISVSVDGIYFWIESDDPAPIFVWDMSELKTRLVGQQGEDVIWIAFEQMPECEPKEIADFTTRLALTPPGVEVLYNLCQFPEPWEEDQINDYINALIDINQNIPEEYDFNQLLDSERLSGESLATVKSVLSIMQSFGQWILIIPLMLLLLILLIGVRSWDNLGKWLGIPLLICGTLIAGTAALAKPTLLRLLLNAISTQMSSILRSELKASLTRLLNHIFQPILRQGAIILGVGVLLIVVMIVAKGVQNKKVKITENEVESGE